MTLREVVKSVLSHNKPPYVPWQFQFTYEAREKLQQYFGTEDIGERVGNHFITLGNDIGFFDEIGNDRFIDMFGTIWDRTVDKDIGIVEIPVLPEPSLKGYTFPNPEDKRFFEDILEKMAKYPEHFRIFSVGFSLYERAWSMRGMENLLLDLVAHPKFVQELFASICEYNITHVKKALTYDIDAVFYGDDWGQQSGLIMGPKLWFEFIEPHLKEMCKLVKDAGKDVFIHSCGDIDELFDHLITMGVDCINPFQPEVMDVYSLMKKYRKRLCFFGGLSTQRTLPHGSADDVREESRKLLEIGKEGGYIFAPAHDVLGDVPLENILAFVNMAQNQPGKDDQ